MELTGGIVRWRFGPGAFAWTVVFAVFVAAGTAEARSYLCAMKNVENALFAIETEGERLPFSRFVRVNRIDYLMAATTAYVRSRVTGPFTAPPPGSCDHDTDAAVEDLPFADRLDPEVTLRQSCLAARATYSGCRSGGFPEPGGYLHSFGSGQTVTFCHEGDNVFEVLELLYDRFDRPRISSRISGIGDRGWEETTDVVRLVFRNSRNSGVEGDPLFFDLYLTRGVWGIDVTGAHYGSTLTEIHVPLECHDTTGGTPED